MHIESLRTYVMNKEAVTEGFPFGVDTLVFKVHGKMFLLASLDAVPLSMNVKCNPEKAIELRDEFPEHVLPGYHMNKVHWNTIIIDGTIHDRLLKEWIDDSYALISSHKKKK